LIEYPNVTNLASQDAPGEVTVDILIVGSGAGGGIAAEILSRSGLNVLIVEEGPLRTAKDFKLNEKQAYAELYQEVAARQTVDKSIQILQGRCVGGSTTVNWTSSFRTPEKTLAYWQTQFGLSAFSRETLDPWFDWAEKRLNIATWQVPPNRNNQSLADGAARLGWSFQTMARNVKNCANLGYCGTGCPLNAKQSMLVSCIPTALNLGAQLFTRARVEQLILQQGRVQGAWISRLDRQGQATAQKAIRVRAKHTILAAGAIGSPAILLRSELSQLNRQIGSRTFLHPVTASIARMPHQIDGFQGAPQSIYSDQFLWRDGVSGELGYKIEVPPLHPLLASTLLRHHGERHYQMMQDFPYFQANLALLRDGFHEKSIGGQVSLDSYGYPQLDYPISDVLWRGFQHAMLRMTEIQFAAGAEKVYPLHMDASYYLRWSEAQAAINGLTREKIRWQIMSAHVMGGCTLGETEQNSVCNPQGEVHGLAGLSVMDGSLFPTSLGVNPQLSIYAIVAKLATQLAAALKADIPEELAQRL